MRFYIAVGSHKDWQKFSSPKPAQFRVTTKNGNLFLGLPEMTWKANAFCNISHWYLLEDDMSLVRMSKLEKILSVRKNDTVTVMNLGFELVDLHLHEGNTDSTKPYLV